MRGFPQIALHLYEANGELQLRAGSVQVVHRGHILYNIHFSFVWTRCDFCVLGFVENRNI